MVGRARSEVPCPIELTDISAYRENLISADVGEKGQGECLGGMLFGYRILGRRKLVRDHTALPVERDRTMQPCGDAV